MYVQLFLYLKYLVVVLLQKKKYFYYYFQVIQSTGVSAVGVHGRTKDERPNHPNHLDVLQKVSQHCKIPMIANGGSANTRDSPINTYQGIRNFWKETGADSVMIARAAEWNPSVFSPNGKSDIYQIVDKYLDYAIKYDQPFIISKYNIQQHLGGDQVISWNFCCSTKKNYFLRPL